VSWLRQALLPRLPTGGLSAMRQIAFFRAGANANMISMLSARELEILRLIASGRKPARVIQCVVVKPEPSARWRAPSVCGAIHPSRERR